MIGLDMALADCRDCDRDTLVAFVRVLSGELGHRQRPDNEAALPMLVKVTKSLSAAAPS